MAGRAAPRSRRDWAFGLVAGALDLVKSGILVVTVGMPKPERRAAWASYAFLTCLSLWCAGGMTATQLATRLTSQIVAATTQQSKEQALEELKEQRKKMPAFAETSAEALETAKQGVTTAKEQADAERGRGMQGDLPRAGRRRAQGTRHPPTSAEGSRRHRQGCWAG